MRLLICFLLTVGLALPAGLTAINEPGYPKMIAAQKGKVVLVNFWATYCVPCRVEMPALVKLQEKYAAKGFVLITISADEPEHEGRAQAFLDSTKVPGARYLRKANDDDAFINSIDAKWSGALPASFLYDRTGKKVKSLIGEADLKALEALIQKLL
jgi:thiol-disulfide isomerase/thioredoxin